jgi:diadenosine tetraphosphatase ApaH/serine/threonine PP2A family protein phosphatase
MNSGILDAAMRRSRKALVALVLFVGFTAAVRALQQPTPPAVALSDAVLTKLSPEWRAAAAPIRATEIEQQRFLTYSDVVLRQVLARLLVRMPAADVFLRDQLMNDPSPMVRTTIVQIIAADSRWTSLADTTALIERVVARDPDTGVSVAALEILRRMRMRSLNALMTERMNIARKRGDDAASLARLAEEQERWVALERGVMLPAFLRTPPAAFAVKAPDTAIRVLAFGDFGNGSPEQKALAATITQYHERHPFDFALTLGDNFYSAGMESPTDPRWQTWFEQLYGPLGVTFYPTLGNHDWGQPDSPAAEILYSGKTATWRMPAAYYTFVAGAVQFFALDTQVIALSEKQRRWLDTELARSQARWKVVYGHHPIYSGGNYQDRPDLIAQLLPILRNRADVYLCGHDHNLQALQPQDGVRFVIAGGGGAGLYELRPYERSIFASRSNGFAVLEADATQLSVKLVDGSGTVLYEDIARKPALTTGPPE